MASSVTHTWRYYFRNYFNKKYLKTFLRNGTFCGGYMTVFDEVRKILIYGIYILYIRRVPGVYIPRYITITFFRRFSPKIDIFVENQIFTLIVLHKISSKNITLVPASLKHWMVDMDLFTASSSKAQKSFNWTSYNKF
jgi:hypothetical protein